MRVLDGTRRRFLKCGSVTTVRSNFGGTVRGKATVLSVKKKGLRVSLFSGSTLILARDVHVKDLHVHRHLGRLRGAAPRCSQLVRRFVQGSLVDFRHLCLGSGRVSGLVLVKSFLASAVFRSESKRGVVAGRRFLGGCRAVMGVSSRSLTRSVRLRPRCTSLVIPGVIVVQGFVRVFRTRTL